MADRVTKALNVEVEKHSKPEYGEGVEQGIKFVGIEGYWKISSLADIYKNDAIVNYWPPKIGHVFFAKLQAKPTKKAGCFYRDIWEIGKATGEAQTWDWQAGLAGAPPSGSQLADNAAPDVASPKVDETRRSIERQVVLKAMAEVIAASVSDDGDFAPNSKIDKLYETFVTRCDELWNGAVPAEPSKPPKESAQEKMELDNDSIPF